MKIMKSKIYLIAFLAFSIALNVNGQTGNPAALFRATITQTSSNSLMASFRPNMTFSGQFSNLQFTFQIPSTVTPQPTVSIKSNPLSAFVPTGSYTVDTKVEGSYITYAYNVIVAGAPVFSFVAGTDYNALEVSFSTNSGSTTPIRMAHLANGGSTAQQAFYVEINGNDNTDYTTTFTGAGAVNGGSYNSYSYVEVANFVLPVKFTSFTANKKDDNALLNWTVTNETTSVDLYEIERSLDGSTFRKINTISKSNGANNTNSYNYTDANISVTKSNGTIYYRIKQVDIDGRFVYSEIKNIKSSQGNWSMTVFPNPVKTNAILQVDVPASSQLRYSIVSSSGKNIQNNTLQINKGINTEPISMDNFASGTYLLTVIMGETSKTIKIIKE